MPVNADYIISLPNNKTRLYDIMGWILLGLHMTGFLYILFTTTERDKWGDCGYALSLPLVYFILEYFLLKKKREFHGLKFSLATLPAIWYFKFDYVYIGLITLVLSILYFIARRSFRILFTGQYIIYPSFPGRKIKWNELSNLILKDGLLTIDFKNNKLIQQEIDVNDEVDEKEFNVYCLEKIGEKFES